MKIAIGIAGAGPALSWEETVDFVREAESRAEFGGLTGQMYASSVRNALQSALFLPVILTLASLSTGLALAVGGLDVIAGSISIGTLVAFIEYASKFFRPVQELSQRYTVMQAAMASAALKAW